MAPKSDIRAAIANALDIDIQALSDINISSLEDVMFIFFELEERLGMNIEKKDGHTYLSFDDNNRDLKDLITYLNIWHNQKNALIPDPENTSDEQKRDYDLWKSRFSKNIQEYFNMKENEINNHYADLVKKIAKSVPYAKKTLKYQFCFEK